VWSEIDHLRCDGTQPCPSQNLVPLRQYEAFGVCRTCKQGTIFVIDEEHDDPDLFDRQSPLQVKGVLNDYFNARSFISLKDQTTVAPPEHVPPNIANVFREAARLTILAGLTLHEIGLA
jgi:hypothetical protein